MKVWSLFPALAAVALAVPAAAGETTGRSSVNYRDLDLSTEAGREELSKRFDQAAREMCGVTGEKAAAGRQRYCYERTSKQVARRVEAILAEQGAAQASGG